jgi:transaldolase
MPVFVALDATTAEVAAEQAERLGRAADNVVIQLPFAEPYIPLMHRLAAGGVKVAATFLGSAAQVMLAARTGVAFLFVDVDRIDAGGADSANVLRQSRAVLDRAASECDLVAVFPSPASTVIASAQAGADAAVVGAAALRALTAYPFTDQSLVDPSRRPSQGERLRAGPG